MKRITLGKTGLQANRLGFGGIPIQRLDEKSAVDVVLHAIEAGADFIDTSRMYTNSEHRIGLALKKTQKKPILATKSHQAKAEGVRRDLEISFQKLGVDYIDLYQCHLIRDQKDYDLRCGPGGALEELMRARDKGIIGHIGITSHSLEVLERAIEEGRFETIMTCFGILEPKSQESVIPKALESNIGIMAMKPFAGGIIDRAELALRFTLSQPGVLVLAGIDDNALFDENWEFFQKEDWQLRPQDWREIEDLRAQFNSSFCRRCDYCQPCPEEINIQFIMNIPSMVKRMGLDQVMQKPVKDWVETARNCRQCGDCESRCPYELPISTLVAERLDWLDQMMAKQC